MDEYLPYIVGLAIDGLISLYFTEQYYQARKLFIAFTRSVEKGVNCLDEDERNPHYAVVRGEVKSTGPPIKSLGKSFMSGVVHELKVKEFFAEKTGVGLWVNRERIMDVKRNVVPFQLQDGKFKINVTSPLDAEFLDLEVIDNNFEPSSSTFLGFLCGFQKKGIQHTECMLKEKSILTGFGEVQTKNGMVTLIPPRNGVSYILTTMDPESLTNALASRKKFYGVCCFIFSAIGFAIAGAFAYKYWKARLARRRIQKMNDFVRLAQIERRKSIRTSSNPSPEVDFTCIICYIRPREMVLLPCGHISLCADCALKCMNDPCPICRQPVLSINLIYIS